MRSSFGRKTLVVALPISMAVIASCADSDPGSDAVESDAGPEATPPPDASDGSDARPNPCDGG
ncbi:MAG: hypothetical protein K0S65_2803, partial [Labilithrix sp.]|nr:hypothetical protein [Labilithrix sp.]